MSLIDILDDIRRPYLQQLSAAIAAHDYHIEPMLCGSDGLAIRDGILATPCRYDLVCQHTGAVLRIDAIQNTVCAPVELDLGSVATGAVLELVEQLLAQGATALQMKG